jgi:hypothetical protein
MRQSDCGASRAIAATRRFANYSAFRQSGFERRCESGLRRIAKGGPDQRDRFIAVAQHVHGLLEPVLAQPRMR